VSAIVIISNGDRSQSPQWAAAPKEEEEEEEEEARNLLRLFCSCILIFIRNIAILTNFVLLLPFIFA
jgi:hypothetical protein